jgi:hypothetical protein
MQPTVVLSMEIELRWGVNHLPGRQGLDRHSEGREAETTTLERLLTLCDGLELPITFDVVGHLLLDDCAGTHDSPHRTAWFASDPGTDEARDPLYYAPDLVRQIQRAETDHEICTHTFSHAACHTATDDVVSWELDAARRTHEAAGLDEPTSFVPPMHAPCPPSLLREHGIRAVRRPVSYRPPVDDPEPPDSLRRSIPWHVRRAYPVEVLARSHPVRTPELVDGVVEHYTSWHASLTAPYLPNGRIEPHPLFRLLPQSLRRAIHRRYLRDGLDRAIAAGSCVHYWSHLFNLANDAQWPPVESFLRAIARERSHERVRVATMETLTEEVRRRHA